MNKTEKNEMIAGVAEKFRKSKALYMIDYKGITVAEVSDLRREFRKSKIEYKVIKNTLAKRAIDEAGKYTQLKDHFQGMVGLAISYDDAVAPAKVLKKFIEKYKKLELKACYVEDTYFAGNKLDLVASLPDKPSIIAGILGSLQSPVSGIVGVINAVIRDIVGVIDAIEKKKSESN